MWCDIKNSKYGKKLTSQIGERNAKEFAMGIQTPKFKNWFGEGKTVKTEEGVKVPFINPAMQMINDKNDTFNILERFRFQGLTDVERFLQSGIDGITRRTNGIFDVHSTNLLVNQKLLSEIDRIYPGLIVMDSARRSFVINPNFQYDYVSTKSVFPNQAEERYVKFKTLLDKLSNRFNIPYTFINDKGKMFKGMYQEHGKVIINLAHVSGDTPFHEFIHPFVILLKNENPQLYYGLLDEMRKTKDGLDALAYVQRNYKGIYGEHVNMEAITTYLGKLAEAKYNKPNSLFDRFWKWITSVFKKINIPLDIKQLSPETTLDQIASYIVDDIFVADLKAATKYRELVVQEQRVDTELTYENLYDRIKDRIAILNATIKNRKQGDQFKEDIQALKDIIENADEITSINNFVANSLAYVDAAHRRFESLRDSLKDLSKLSKSDISQNMYVLGEIQQLLNVYDSLDDVKSLYVREGVKSTDDTMAKLREAIDKKDAMVQDFKSFALTYLTEWLFPYIEPTNKLLENEGNKDSVITKDNFREQLKIALRDISAAGYWLGATINSQDPISAAVGLALKDVVYDNHVKDLKTKDRVESAYNRARGTQAFVTEAAEKEFNMQFMREVDNYEKIGEDPDGKDIFGYVKRLAFHTEYKTDEFEKARREFYRALGPRPNRASKFAHKRWQQEVSKWYSQNTVVNAAQIASVIAQKKMYLSKRQFDRWILENTKEVEDEKYENGMTKSELFGNKVYNKNEKKGTFRIYSGELVLPSNKYRNAEFSKLMHNDYYRELYNAYREANDKLGNYGLKHGIIPQHSKGKNLFSDLSWKKGVKGNLKTIGSNALGSIESDFDSSRTVQRQDGTEVKKIPIKYTKMLDPQDLKTDLFESVLKFSQMANNYEGMTELEPNILILKTVINGDFNLGIKGREIAKTNSKGAGILNAVTKKIVPKMAHADMLNKRLDEFINDVVYGDEEFKETVNILGEEISLNKVGDKIAMLTALQNMALNLTGGISNVVIGNFNNTIEAVGGRFWGKADWAFAQKEYFANVHHFLGEIAGVGESQVNHLADHYDVPQGEFQDQFGSNVSGGKVNQLLKTSSLFFLQKGGEHQIQITGLLSLMHATKIKDKKGAETNLYDAWKKAGSFEKLQNDYQWTAEDDKAFRNRLHGITKTLQGIYNKFDKSVLQRRWLGKLAIMFRKYMFSSFKARYGGKYVDYEIGTIQEGYWNTFVKKIVSEVKDYKWAMIQRMWTKEGYSEMEKAAFNKTVYELGVILSTFVLAGFANGDDDKSWLEAETALQLTRMSADITQYLSPTDFIRVIRNPAASVNMVEKYIGWFTQLASPTEEYERASGIAKKGDNKLYIKTLKLMPVIRQIVNFMTPEEQLKFYQLTGSK